MFHGIPDDDAWRHALRDRALPQLLAVIVDRAEGDRVAKLMHAMRIHSLYSARAEGTAGKSFADLLGFTSSARSLIFGVGPSARIAFALEELRFNLHLDRPGHGIAFTVPISGMSFPERIPIDERRKAHIREIIDANVQRRSEQVQHDLILAIVNQGHSTALVERCQDIGIPGGTVLNVRFLGAEHAARFLGVALQPEREAVAMLVQRESKAAITACVSGFFNEHAKAQGIMLALPVEDVVGLSGGKAQA